MTFVAASGDSGTTEYPSASPNVLSVGGTTLNVTSQGIYVSETPWSQTGTGTSPFESQPSWQAAATSAAGLSSTGRTTPDVSFDANPSTGVSVYDSVPYGGRSGWYTVGGTSVGAPSWAGLIAVADQGLALNGVGSLSNAQASLYQISSSELQPPRRRHDLDTTYALTTGLGSPKASQVVSALVQLNTPHDHPDDGRHAGQERHLFGQPWEQVVVDVAQRPHDNIGRKQLEHIFDVELSRDLDHGA